ncbi:O-antigen ligase family protein [Anaerosalibacter sp. Marseille-P3206]|uniref:O-antigen ligase family protein n=1 Tax=Anaerosalibacter sp. Marseille-P3206 TaxID=1871005 RepID=UPI000985AE6D|nr:O-antigen ligase family protein [Anaerosalibacter sp. Marseille-P3206]
MVVENLKKKQYILPILLGIVFGVLYFKLPLRYFAAIFLGSLVAIAILHDVKVGLFLSILVLPFMPDELNLIFMLFIFLAFVYREVFRDINPLTKNPIDMPIALFVILIIISTITSINPMGSFRDLAIHLLSISFMFVMVNNIKDKNELNILLTIMVATASLVALYGLYQYKVGVEMEAKWLDTTNNEGITTRVFSVFGNPNILAEYLIMVTPISIALFWQTKSMFKKFLFLLTSLLLTGTLVLTFSRGGWLGFAFGIFIFILLVEKRLLLLLIPLGLGAINFLPPTILNRILSIANFADSSNNYRIRIWKITLDIIKDYLPTGVGFGYIPFKQTFETYIRTMPAYHSHNTYLETLAEMGIPGIVVLIMLIFIIYKYSIKTLVKGEDKWTKVISAGILSGISALLMHGAVENVLYLPKIIITFWTLVSFLLVLMRLSEESRDIG